MGSNSQKQVSLVSSLALIFFVVYQIIVSLSHLKNTENPEQHLAYIAICLFAFFFPILGGWISFKLPGGIFFSVLGAGLVIFSCIVAGTPVFMWNILEYFLLILFLFRMDDKFENEIAASSVDRESNQNKKNDLSISYRNKGEAISMLFEKYSTYYNMRKLAEELALSLSVQELCDSVARRSLDFILRGDIAILSLVSSLGPIKPVTCARDNKNILMALNRDYQTDIFDHWVIKNRRRLIVLDAYQDFRFDAKEAERNSFIRSLIISPLVQDGRIIGSLRIHSSKAEAFSNDDLRLLDNIAVLGAAAISNAILYEQTKELAIKDSLTGLYVRRYFFERLKDEHRRSLLTNKSLSVLMCDLDHFKQCNDRYGHGAGDQMLIHFAEILRKTSENAIVARYGGEEFSVILPETSKKQAVELANKIRENLKNTPFIIRREKINTTVSIGVANLPEDTLEKDTLMQLADQALYEAKRSGRDRVC